jgi:nitrite reductase/ring-hydroxylating ferredoxin subunit
VIEGGKVVCPWHGWAYDPKTGQVGDNPDARVQVYGLKMQNGDVLIQL